MRLSRAQQDALGVLVAQSPSTVMAWKRRTQPGGQDRARLPLVNMIAVRSLVDLGLARTWWPSHSNPYRHDMKYSVTPAGLEAWEALRS